MSVFIIIILVGIALAIVGGTCHFEGGYRGLLPLYRLSLCVWSGSFSLWIILRLINH